MKTIIRKTIRKTAIIFVPVIAALTAINWAYAQEKSAPGCSRLTPISKRPLETYSKPVVLTPTTLYDKTVQDKKEVLTVGANQHKTQAAEIQKTRDQAAHATSMLKRRADGAAQRDKFQQEQINDVQLRVCELAETVQTLKTEIGKLREAIKATEFTLSKATAELKKVTDWKIADHERRLSGVQGQVTVLHTKINNNLRDDINSRNQQQLDRIKGSSPKGSI